MTAGYLTLTNPGDRPLILTRVRSPAFDSIELHTTIMEDGVAKMREDKGVQVPPKGSVAFEPGGRHLMMFGARRPLTVGEKVTLVLEIDAGRDAAMLTVEVEAAIRRGGDRDHHHH
jgi:copper(I)-binding protein